MISISPGLFLLSVLRSCKAICLWQFHHSVYRIYILKNITKGWFPFSLVIVPADLTELQVAVSDVNGRYEKLGEDLKERLNRQQASLELRQKAREGTEELKSWLSEREHSLKQGQTTSPSRPEVVRAQAQENKVKSCTCLSYSTFSFVK